MLSGTRFSWAEAFFGFFVFIISTADTIGLNLLNGEPEDAVEREILEPLKITRQAISGATEAAISILRIDDVLWAQMEAQVPDDIQQQIQGFGAEWAY